MAIRLVSIYLLLIPSALPMAYAQGLAHGEILERVACERDPNQSYALYLPSGYSPQKKWPILYAFDAGGRGLLPVQRFRASAEKYGYIIAGSNNSKNGPIRIVEEALDALLADTESRFSLDPRRVYLTGFSGGARVAVSIALTLKGRVAGVIACGAGFPPSIKPTASIPFAFFGTAGIEDFSFPELKELDQLLATLGVPHRFESFFGGHAWAPEDICTRAIEWMELQAMKSGIRPRDETLMDALFSRAEEDARASEQAQRGYEAFQRYSALVSDFTGIKDVAPFDLRARRARASNEVIKALAQENNVTSRQQSSEATVYQLLDEAVFGDNRQSAAQEAVQMLGILKAQAEQKINEADRLVGVRVLTSSWIRLNESAAADLARKDYFHAALRFGLLSQIRPDNPQVYYQLARAYALGGRKKQALDALGTAVKKGFADASALEREADFDSLRKEPAYFQIQKDLAVRK